MINQKVFYVTKYLIDCLDESNLLDLLTLPIKEVVTLVLPSKYKIRINRILICEDRVRTLYFSELYVRKCRQNIYVDNDYFDISHDMGTVGKHRVFKRSWIPNIN